jgi:molybdate transport system ATP-binding protein
MTVACEDVVHRAGEFVLHADFAVPPSGITVLSGTSGAGKSLTLALLAGLRRPDRGRIVLLDRVVADPERGLHVPARQREVGMVFQDSLLLPHRSALDNVALAARRHSGRERRRDHARRMLAEVGGESLAEARPGTLSGGERQRVALARALAGEPRALLLDEPFSALDRSMRRELQSVVRRVVETRAVPALLVTHDLDELHAMADHVLHFGIGRTAELTRAAR